MDMDIDFIVTNDKGVILVCPRINGHVYNGLTAIEAEELQKKLKQAIDEVRKQTRPRNKIGYH